MGNPKENHRKTVGKIKGKHQETTRKPIAWKYIRKTTWETRGKQKEVTGKPMENHRNTDGNAYGNQMQTIGKP